MSEVNAASKFPKVYSLTGLQIPAAKFQLQPCREEERTQLALLDASMEADWPPNKCKADENERL